MKSAWRRVERLERLLGASAREVEHASLAPAEIEDIARRLYAGESLDAHELARLKRHGHFCRQNVSVSFKGEQLIVKRLLGIDWDAL